MRKVSELENSLKSNGLKITKHRLAILNVLEQSSQPIDAEKIFNNLKKNDISISLSTIYRTLETLIDKNIVAKINIIDENKALFEYNKMVHKHFLICTECKKILDINYCPLGAYEKALEQDTDFKISCHSLNIYGLCPKCKNSINKI